MKLKAIPATAVACSYCEAKIGEECQLVLCPEVGPLSIKWYHRVRLELAAA